MDKKLVKFIEAEYQMAVTSGNTNDISAYIHEVVGACCYEYERTGEWDVLNLWYNEWRDKLVNNYNNPTEQFIDDVFDYVAIAFQIPPQMLKGSIADSDKTWDNYMTFCIKPLSELLEKEINRKMYSKDDFLNRTYLKVDTNMIRPGWIVDLANAVDILTRNGVNTLDDNLELLGRERVGGELGETRFTTLNLQTMESALKGGDNQNEKREDRL